MSRPIPSTRSALARRLPPSVSVVLVLSFWVALAGCNGEQGPARPGDSDSDLAANESDGTSADDATDREGTEAANRAKDDQDDWFQLYLRARTRIPTAGYECAFAVSFQNRSSDVVELPEGSLVTFFFVHSDRPNDKPVTRTVSLEQTYRVPPNSITDLEDLWVKIPEAGSVKVHCEIRQPVAVASHKVGLEVERYLLHDAQGPAEPPVVEPPGDTRRFLPVAPKD